MGDYIGDRGSKGSGKQTRSSGQRVSDETKMFDISASKNAAQRPGSKSAQTSKNTSSQSRNPQTKSASSSGRGTQPKNGTSSKSSSSQSRSTASKSSASSTSKSKSTSPKSTSTRNASQDAYYTKGTSAKNISSKSSSPNFEPSRGGSSSSKSSSAKNSGAKSSAKSAQPSFSDTLAAKRNSAEERALHSSEAAKKIKRDRYQRSFRHHRKLFIFLYYAAIFIAVMAVVILMSVTVLFGIENIEVVADSAVPYSSKQIVSACDVECGQNLFTAPIDAAGEQIMSTLPYIEECKVSRKFPSTVIITATAAQPVGVVRDADGGCIVLSSGLRALENVVSPGDAPGVPMVEGVIVDSVSEGEIVTTANPVYIETVAQITKTLAEKGLAVDSIAFSNGGNITAVYDGRITFKFGTSAKLDEKLELAAVLINEGKITKHESGDLDLSINGRATFTPDYVKQQYAPKNDDASE